MKNIFDINIEKGTYDGEVFCTKRVSSDLDEQIEMATYDLAEVEMKAQLSWPLVIIRIICMIWFFGVVSPILEVGLAEAFSNAPYLLIGAVIAGIVWVVIEIYEKRKNRQMEDYVTDNNILKSLDDLAGKAAKELEIPEDKVLIDVLSDTYEIKRGKKKSMSEPIVLNNKVDMYFKGDKLCFADFSQEFSIDLADIVRVEKEKKNISIANWNKDEGYKSAKFKKYKISTNNYGYLVKGFYSVQIQSVWGKFEVRLPNYEEEAVLKILEKKGKNVLV